jgi:DNA-binding GntR family transcriptional regulator
VSSLAQGAYERVRTAVAQGELEPGEPVLEVELAVRLRMSRTPVREALLRLELEGYVERDDQSRLVVHPLTRREVAETFMVRQMLEAHAIGLAASRISDEELARLDELVDADRRALGRRRVDVLASLNDEFHNVILVASRNRTLTDLVRNLRGRIYGLNAFVVGSPEDQRRFVEEHATMVQLLREGDDEAAVGLLQAHLTHARDLLLAGLPAGEPLELLR